MYIQYDSQGFISPNVSLAEEEIPNFPAMPGYTALFLDDTQYADVRNNITQYKVINGVPVKQSFFTLSAINGTITATLNNPPSTPPTNCKFTLLGNEFDEPLTNNVATISFVFHPAAVGQSAVVEVSCDAANSIPSSVNIGGLLSSFPIQAYADTTDGKNHITPIQKAVFQGFYALTIPSQIVAANTLTSTSLLLDLVGNILTTPAVISALSDNQKNVINDLKANVLGNLPITFENAFPLNGTKNIHYADFVTNMPVFAEASLSYIKDVTTIPNLV